MSYIEGDMDGAAIESLGYQLERKTAELKAVLELKTKLADWNDALRVTIGDYLNDRANKADLKLALTSWTTRPVNPEWTADMMKALERAVVERDKLREALEKIQKGIDHPGGVQEAPDFYEAIYWASEIARAALKDSQAHGEEKRK